MQMCAYFPVFCQCIDEEWGQGRTDLWPCGLVWPRQFFFCLLSKIFLSNKFYLNTKWHQIEYKSNILLNILNMNLSVMNQKYLFPFNFFPINFYIFIFLFEVQLTQNVVFVSDVQQIDSVFLYIHRASLIDQQ